MTNSMKRGRIVQLLTKYHEDTVIGILKFVSPEYSADFEESNLFFNNLQNFHSIEHKEVGDPLEGVISNTFGNKDDTEDKVEMYMRRLDSPNSKIQKISVKEVTLKNTSDLTKEFKICCFSIIRFSDLVINENGEYKLSEKFIDDLKGIIDGRNIYITVDLQAFINKISCIFSTKDTYFKTAIVRYFDKKHPLFSKVENNEDLLVRDIIDASFYKTKKYANQKEYRILTHKLRNNKVKIEGLYDIFSFLKNLDEVTFKLHRN